MTENSKNFNFKVAATVHPVIQTEEYEELLEAAKKYEASFEDAATGPLDANGKPRMLHLSAWIAHEGRNLNGAAFVKEELEKVVTNGLFSPPHGGMIDYNHDYTPIGFWYKTTFAYHEQASKWGILAQGAIWAWRFEDIANKLLAAMFEQGHIEVSMAALANGVEVTKEYPGSEGDYTIILHNPVFFTTSVLDIPPADPDARGIASSSPLGESAVPASEMVVAGLVINNEEENIMDELETLKTQLDEAHAKIAILENEKQALETSKADLISSKEELEKQLATKVTELEAIATSKAELEVALASANEQVSQITTKLSETIEQLEQFKKSELEKEAVKRLEARLSELPEVVVRNLNAHEEKEVLMQSWKEASEDDWQKIKKMFSLADKGISYGERSEREGPLPSLGVTDSDSNSKSLSSYLK